MHQFYSLLLLDEYTFQCVKVSNRRARNDVILPRLNKWRHSFKPVCGKFCFNRGTIATQSRPSLSSELDPSLKVVVGLVEVTDTTCLELFYSLSLEY